MTIDQLLSIMPYGKPSKLALYLPHLNKAMADFSINTAHRVSAFVAQIAHETGSLKYMEEIASGRAYEGRIDLGNVHPGDGPRYKGRGAFQLTGRANYDLASDRFGVDFIERPDMAAAPEWAFQIAGWYWERKQLNHLADISDFVRITRRINGGLNGLADRVKYYNLARTNLGLPTYPMPK